MVFTTTPFSTSVNFPGTPALVYGTGTLTVYFEGDFGDFSEYIEVIDENTNVLADQPGSTNYMYGDCPGFEDSLAISISAAAINAWAANGSIDFTFNTTNAVDLFCSGNYLRAKLEYAYCPTGSQIAAFNPMPANLCDADDAIALSGTPTGGSFSGPGVVGSTFDPTINGAGEYIIYYTATDVNTGCTSTAQDTLFVLGSPQFPDYTICPDSSITLGSTGGSSCGYAWFDSELAPSPFYTGGTFTTPNLTQTTTYWVASADSVFGFQVDTLLSSNSMVVDHDMLTGDDRAGIAVTPDYVYIVGDNSTGRFDLNLGNGVSLPIRDGIFSDLASGDLWTLYSSSLNSDPYNWPTNFVVDRLVMMDSSLNLMTSSYLTLSQPIDMSTVYMNNNGIMAGYGFVVVYSDTEQKWYSISLCNGEVTELFADNNPMFYYGENWADWGVAAFDGTDYYAIYRASFGTYNDVYRKNLSTGVMTPISAFTSVSDMCSFTFNPWNNRWYFHYEGSGQFGGSSETLGYADATATISSSALPLASNGCRNEFTIHINSIDLGPDTTICMGNTVTLFAGVGYTSYTWNGINNNYNTYAASTSETVNVAVVDQMGCTLTDTIVVTVDSCAGIYELEGMAVDIFPNPTSGNVTIDIDGYEGNGNVSVLVTSLEGRTVQTATLTPANNMSAEVSLNDQPSGLYLVTLSTEQGKLTLRLVKN